MPLSPGVRLGAYEVVGLIFAGGMGEVYQARDTRLDRVVALKVLPERFSADSDRRERFDREARAIAALNHPHICGLLDVGESAVRWSPNATPETVCFLVMEHLEGETLAERLLRGPLAFAEALRYATEIAEALVHAHEHGLVHRDLKPGNVMITTTGAKLLDFGLSKPHDALGAPALATVSRDEAPLTNPGTILGTYPYMAPEVLEGRDADERSDVFALGAVVYEMIAGERPFQGRTVAGVIGAVLHTDPRPLSAMHAAATPALEHFVARCLAKSPDLRWQTARDAMLELTWIAQHVPGTELRTPHRRTFAWAVPAAAAFALVASVAFRLSSAGVPPPVSSATRVVFAPPDGLSLTDVAIAGPVTVSPDGRQLVFSATGPDGKTLLWLRRLDSLTARALPGTDRGVFPFWSPDSESLGFFAQRKLKTIRLAGGPPQILCDAVLPRGGTWNQQGVIVFSAGAGRELSRVASQGGVIVT